MIPLLRQALLLLAVILAPVWLGIYGIWIAGGRIADLRGQRAVALLKGQD